MFHFRILIPAAALVLLLGGCIVPPGQDTSPPPEPTLEPASELPAEDLLVVVSQNANVRTGPSTDHSIAYGLTAGNEVTVVGRTAAGAWLQIEHQDRPGWIFAVLTDIADRVAELPAGAPPTPAAPDPTVAAEPEPTPQPAQEPTPEPQAEPHSHVHATVVGTIVNLRQGPSTDHPTAGHVQTGDELRATGRNADGSWLQVMHPAATGELVWLYGPLTDIDTAALQVLAVVAAAPPPAQQSATPTVPADCSRLHTVNPNETRLQQITDWLGLDLRTVANLNGIDANAPLTAGAQICLTAGPPAPPPAPQTTTGQATPPPAPLAQAGSPGEVVKYETGDCRTHGGHVYPCRNWPPNWPEQAVTELTGVPTKYYAPGTYDRSEHPGLAYEWELKFSDSSHQWDWAVRDFENCYDALRVLYGEVPETVGLKSLEFRLSDSREGSGEGDRRGMGLSNVYLYPETYFEWTFPDSPRETWQPSDLPHPDMANTAIRCFAPRGHPEDEVFCRIEPKWGNAGSINLEWTVVRAMSLAAEQMSRRAITRQYNWNHPIIVDLAAYLTPIIDDGQGHAAGYGPCMQLTRVR